MAFCRLCSAPCSVMLGTKSHCVCSNGAYTDLRFQGAAATHTTQTFKACTVLTHLHRQEFNLSNVSCSECK